MEVTSYLLGKKQGGGGSEPTGTIDITSNGSHNVKSYATANVNVPTGITPTGTINITENGTSDVTNYASASVNVQPDLEAKSITITENTTTTITPTQGKDGLSSVQVTTNVSGGQTLTIESGSISKAGFQKVIENIPSLDISGTSCNYMFYNYTGNTIPVLNGTSNVTKMEYMFWNCINVTNFNLDNWDTSNVTSMKAMFECDSAVAIRNLDCSSFNVGKVTNMVGMFKLYQLAILDISNFDFSGVTNFGGMFSSCGTYCKQVDGAYADGIPYVYVKDATAQNWVLTENNGHPNTWSTNNVLIKSS